MIGSSKKNNGKVRIKDWEYCFEFNDLKCFSIREAPYVLEKLSEIVTKISQLSEDGCFSIDSYCSDYDHYLTLQITSFRDETDQEYTQRLEQEKREAEEEKEKNKIYKKKKEAQERKEYERLKKKFGE